MPSMLTPQMAHEYFALSEVWSLRGTLLARDGKADEAEAAYHRALDAWPGNRAAHKRSACKKQRQFRD